MNDENLTAHQFQSGSKAREMGRLGGVKSGESKRRQKFLGELMRNRLNDLVDNEKVKDALRKNGFAAEDVIQADIIVESTLKKAQAGDIQAVKLIFEMTEGKVLNLNIEHDKPKPAIVIDPYEEMEDDGE